MQESERPPRNSRSVQVEYLISYQTEKRYTDSSKLVIDSNRGEELPRSSVLKRTKTSDRQGHIRNETDALRTRKIFTFGDEDFSETPSQLPMASIFGQRWSRWEYVRNHRI
jgi:hypothetical protein